MTVWRWSERGRQDKGDVDVKPAAPARTAPACERRPLLPVRNFFTGGAPRGEEPRRRQARLADSYVDRDMF